jgi:hypothetical protein
VKYGCYSCGPNELSDALMANSQPTRQSPFAIYKRDGLSLATCILTPSIPASHMEFCGGFSIARNLVASVLISV